MAKFVDYRIILSNTANISEKRAASFVRQNLKLVCGKTIPIVTDNEQPVENEIVIGKTNVP